MKKLKGIKIKKLKENLSIKNFIWLFIAGIVNSIGVTIFLFPVSLYDSGISGLSMLLDKATPDYLPLSIFLLLLNIPIFIYGYKKQGLSFTIYSVFSVIIYSIFSFLITNVLPIDLSGSSPITESDLILCSIFGGTISGIGSGLVIRNGGAIDGIDVLSVLFAKKLGISIGNFVLIFDFILYIGCGIFEGSWILPLYSLVAYFIGSKTVDFIVDGLDRSKCAMIITTKSLEIDKELSKEFSSSGTLVKAVGGYSKTDKTILYYVVNHFQLNKLKNIVRSIDPNAFIAIQEVSEVVKTNQK